MSTTGEDLVPESSLQDQEGAEGPQPRTAQVRRRPNIVAKQGNHAQ